MAYDEGLAERIRDLVRDVRGIEEKKMFGGLGFLVNGNMSVGIWKNDLIVRTPHDDFAKLRKQKHARDFDITGRPMKGWLLVQSTGVAEDKDLQRWVKIGVSFATSLPEK